MQYYLISFIVTIFIFIIIQYFEYTRISNENTNDDNDYNYNEPYSLFTINNCLLFMIIYIVSTIIAYYVYSANIDLSFLFNKTTSINNNSNENDNNDIDPKILSKINDNFSVGFEPFNSDNDSSDTDSE